MDYCKIKEAAQNYQEDMTRFLRAIVKNPGESCDERKHIETIEAEMKKLGFDEVVIDPQGNVIGYMGTGDKIIAFRHSPPFPLLLKHQATPNDYRRFYRCNLRLQRRLCVRWRFLWFRRWGLVLGGVHVID